MTDTDAEQYFLLHTPTNNNNMTTDQLSRQRLASAIKQHNTTQRELADRINVNQSTISQVVTGKRPVSAELAKALAYVFGKKPGYWLGESEPVAQEPFIGGTVHPLTGRIV